MDSKEPCNSCLEEEGLDVSHALDPGFERRLTLELGMNLEPCLLRRSELLFEFKVLHCDL
jgi:hypothetical protein